MTIHSRSRRLPALDDIVELGIGADAVVADQQARRNSRMRRHRAPRDRRDRIGGVGDAEDDFVIGIVEGEDRGERLLGERLDAAQRLDDRDRRRVGGGGKRLAAAAAADGGDGGAEDVQRETAASHAGGQGGDRHRGPQAFVRREFGERVDIAGSRRRFYEGAWPPRPTVRFAPSPTGFIHIGNARTALINWLLRPARRRALRPALRRHRPRAVAARIRRRDRGRPRLARNRPRPEMPPVGADGALRSGGRDAEARRAGSIPPTRRPRSSTAGASASRRSAARRSTIAPRSS